MEESPTPQSKKKLGVILLCIGGVVLLGAYIWIDRTRGDTPSQGQIPYTPPSELNVSSTIETYSEEELQARFTESLETLEREVEGRQGDSAELIAYVEERMLTIRFPGSKREPYMAAFLAIEKMKEQPLSSFEETKAEIIRNLSTLK